jgi:hypothetical protein
MKLRLAAIVGVVVLAVGVLLATIGHRPATMLADQLCVGVSRGQDPGVCLPTPH